MALHSGSGGGRSWVWKMYIDIKVVRYSHIITILWYNGICIYTAYIHIVIKVFVI